jgi:long-subunit acyl-CoA synthetase (AMP-forming)
MLTHRNFASLVPKLAASFDFGVGDGLLSVLPLHHTFEFSAGCSRPSAAARRSPTSTSSPPTASATCSSPAT